MPGALRTRPHFVERGGNMSNYYPKNLELFQMINF